jgi:hypothetical protein
MRKERRAEREGGEKGEMKKRWSERMRGRREGEIHTAPNSDLPIGSPILN